MLVLVVFQKMKELVSQMNIDNLLQGDRLSRTFTANTQAFQ